MFGSSNKQTVDHSAGNFAVGVEGNLTQIFVQAKADIFGSVPTEPSLDFSSLEHAIERGQANISSLMRWEYRLVEKLYGRDREISDIIEWAETPRPEILVRLIEGEGGSGKTRLAAEVAKSLRAKDWQAGFLSRSGSLVHAAGKNGLLLILDYPEEQVDRLKALVDSIRSCKHPGYRLRILLLSRRSFEEWGDTFAQIPDLVGQQSIAALGPLPTSEAHALVIEASSRLARHLGRSDADDYRGLNEWLAANEKNRVSLHATAAAIHHVLFPDATFGLSATRIIADLVQRETTRVNGASEAAGLGRHALSRLLALATVSGKLTPAAIARMAKPELQVFECPANLVRDRLQCLPWWSSNTNILPALTPDILAAAFASRVLKEQPDLASPRLWAALQDGIGLDFAARIGRIVHDIDIVEGAPSPLPHWLEQIVSDNPSTATAFGVLIFDPALPHRLASLAGTTGLALADVVQDDASLGVLLSNTGVHLSNSGRRLEGLQTARRAESIYSRLATARPTLFESDLAASLSNLANHLSDAGDKEGALKAAERAVEIYERLAATDSALIEPDLAMSLNNLANRLNDTGDLEGALGAAQRSAEIYERLAVADPALFEPDMALSLSNLANRLSIGGNHTDALKAAWRAVDIRKRLAAANPARFEPDFASSLNNLGVHLSNAGDNAAALEPAQRAVDIRERLATANPARFEADLAASLNNLANRLSEAGDNVAALEPGRRAVGLYEHLAATSPAHFEPNLATSLMALAKIAQGAADHILMGETASRALPIWRRLAAETPTAHLTHLLQALKDCVHIFATAGMEKEAEAAAAELAAWQRAIETALRDRNQQPPATP